jgi:predicted DNA-binding transcriptional regulator AlpA
MDEQREFLPAREVWAAFGITDRTLDRWLLKTELGFPKPVRINGRRYFKATEVRAWQRARAGAELVT